MKIINIPQYHLSALDRKMLDNRISMAIDPYLDSVKVNTDTNTSKVTGDEERDKIYNILTSETVLTQAMITRVKRLCAAVQGVILLKLELAKEEVKTAKEEDSGIIARPKDYWGMLMANYKNQLQCIKEIIQILTIPNPENEATDE